jgi:hypothetical protein
MAANSGFAIFMEVKNISLLLAFLIEYNVRFDENKNLWVIVGRERGLLPERFCASLESKGFRYHIYS